jgi:putative transport protein
VAYPFGIVGIILTILLIKKIFRVDVEAEVKAAEVAQASTAPAPATRNLTVNNSNLAGQKIGEIPGLNDPEVVVSRYSRGGRVQVARRTTELAVGDVLLVVGPEAKLEKLSLVVGPDADVDLKRVEGPVVNRRLLVTHRGVFGRTVNEVSAFADRGVVVTRVTRGGLQFTPGPQVKLQFGDILMVVGEPEQIDAVAPVVGNAPKALDEPQPITFFIGIALGVLVGSIPVMLPGVPAPVKLGLAGGPLIVAILLSRATNTGPLVWHLPHTANLMLREVGIALFLAAVGLKSGERFAEVLSGPQGIWWMAFGATITFIPLFVVGLLARMWGKLNYVEICGLLSGSMTDPPALAFAQSHTGSTAPAVTYATVYPLTMLLRVFAAQLLIFWLYAT